MSNHPITLPSEDMVQQWRDTWADKKFCCEMDDYIAVRAALWGADQELEACCEWLDERAVLNGATALRAARRPKPPTLKEQALEQLRTLQQCGAGHRDTDKILQALEAL
jgi:hypothetical protein